MADETTPQSGTGSQPPTDDQPAGGPQEGQPQEGETQSRTPEDIEAYWKNRQSQEAAAFAAKEKALRDQLAELNSRESARKVEEQRQGAATQTEAERLRAENAALQEQLKQTQANALTETRRAKYPFAAENLDPQVISVMDEGNLAALNEKLRPAGPPRSGVMDANQAGRSPGAPSAKPMSEKTTAELKADLAALAPEYVESLKGT